ncbi:MAG: DNA-processing protein DprA [Clostridia bacterium]|nr:DNA-processing protein DprA [Clostridia bacterium]
MEQNLYWLWLSEALGPASDCFLPLLDYFGSVEKIYQARKEQYVYCCNPRPTVVTSLCDKDLERAQKLLDRCERLGVGILTYEDPLYPERLRLIHRPPSVLYYRGYLPNFPASLAVAVVGTRGMTDEGRRNGYRIAYDLAVAGVVVVSGMAIGVDGIAHTAALDAQGITVAVLGSAIDQPYPYEHRDMYERLIRAGGIISEYPPGMRTQRWHFPQRNRIISGLCQGTLVVEAGENSGALITAKESHAQGRNVFAVPGGAENPSCAGTNELIKSGFTPVTEALDILEFYYPLYHQRIHVENLDDPANYTAFNNTLRHGAARVNEYRQAYLSRVTTRSAPPNDGVQPEAQTDTPARRTQERRTAPAQKPLREEPYDDGETKALISSCGSPPRDDTDTSSQHTPPPQAAQSPPAEAPALGDAWQASDNDEQEAVLTMIREGLNFDEMCRGGLTSPRLMVALTCLELAGKIRAVPGGRYEIV